MDQIIYHLKNSNRILLSAHTNPDGDAIGSLTAMGLALDALNNGVGKTHIINGKQRHALLLELFTDSGIGTQVIA